MLIKPFVKEIDFMMEACMRTCVSLAVLLAMILCSACQGRSKDTATPLQISSDLSTPPPVEKDNPTAGSNTVSSMSSTQAYSQIPPVIPVLTYDPDMVPANPTLSDAPNFISPDPALEKIINQAKADLAQSLSIDLDHIEAVSVEAVIWPDESLGCGKPGTEYRQIDTPGYQILLEADEKIYTYHTNTSNLIIHCIEPMPLSISPVP
jgi:hypothetical protein